MKKCTRRVGPCLADEEDDNDGDEHDGDLVLFLLSRSLGRGSPKGQQDGRKLNIGLIHTFGLFITCCIEPCERRLRVLAIIHGNYHKYVFHNLYLNPGSEVLHRF